MAIVPPPAVLAELGTAVEPLLGSASTLRWTDAQERHITLTFLGEVAGEVLPELVARLERAVGRHADLTLSVRGAGAFPKRSRATVLWAGVTTDLPAIAALADSVAAAARRAGAPSPDEGRKFRPHVTLARSRRPADLSGLIAALDGFEGQPWPARAVTLVQSHPPAEAGARPQYEQLGSWSLRAR